ncbi:MAG: hypothetical protein NTY07_20335 [Bacteroidia bacterium]|nr:hypothetical protein [Bacteroidia bacterium]
MEKTTNIETEIFHKDNVLICWNPVDNVKQIGYADQLENDGYKVATSYADFMDKYKYPNTIKEELKKNQKRKKVRQEKSEVIIEGLVVLCELNWGLSSEKGYTRSTLSSMSGIAFVMERRRQKMMIPVVFVSFLSRTQQLLLSTKNEIISTPVLGHFYEQLPSKPDNWIKTLNIFKQKLLSNLELEDVKSHFCDPEGMLRELKHDLLKYFDSTESDRSHKFDEVFRRIEDILGYSAKSRLEVLKKYQHKSDKEYYYKIDQISKAIDDFIRGFSPAELSDTETTNPIQVVFLDDELNSDKRFETLKVLMVKNNFVIHYFSNPNKALEKVEADKENLIDIIISDYRIWNKNNEDGSKLMEQMQGYTFLKKCSDLGRTYTYVVFSALDRNFLMLQSGLTGLRIETLYKNGVLANEYSKINFIRNLIDWGITNQKSIASKFSENEVFIKCYNWYRSNSSKQEIENKINQKIIDILQQFDNKVLSHLPISCNYTKNRNSCSGCNLHNTISKGSFVILCIKDYSTNYHNNREEWNPNNEKDVINLINKFAARRLLFYYYSKLSNGNFNCSLAGPISEHLLKSGTYQPGKNSKLYPAKNLWITKDFKKMSEEIEFLKYPPNIRS